MDKILIVKTMFCPDTNCFNTTFDSIKDLLRFIDNQAYKIDILLIGWIKSDKHNNLIQKLIKNYNIYYVRLEVNYGKYFIFKFINKYYDDHIFMFYLDHDIFLDSLNSKVFDIIRDIFKQNSQIGIIAPNQKDDLRHQLSSLDKSITVNNNLLIYNDSFTSIALGCYFICKSCMSIFKNLELLYVYGLDDYYLQLELNKLSYITVVIFDISVTHPYDTNIDYKQWKVQVIRDLVTTIDMKNIEDKEDKEDKEDIDKVNYYKSIEKSINFWNSSP